ncbi:oxygenase MpaB family protein [Isoptericola sp. NPDC056618]|uniref:oxygenase MpaB family protein n=1 Tax=Isoptericola sp. NPDC056618 TaxID=3345878 RepID=UPI0036B03FFE
MSVAAERDYRIVSKERLEGNAQRWRRFGEPTPAGGSLNAGGTPDYGLFGPESVVWEVLLHPATIVFQYAFQGLIQSTYRPVIAGVRDHDPLSRKTLKGTVTFFDLFERGQRNSGMHAPMWLGDTESAQRMWKHLHQIHSKVAGPTIDIGEPELGGYAAAGARDAMWAALTEMHSMLWLYESFAFRDGKLPHRLSPEKRDRYFAEVAAYCRLVGAPEEDIPHSKADMDALYEKYADLFGTPETMAIWPDSGENFAKQMFGLFKKNFHRSQLPAVFYAGVLDHGLFRQLAAGASSGKMRASLGMSPGRSRLAVLVAKLALPFVWMMQRGPFERHYMRLMWGPDGVTLIESARALRERVRAEAV